MKRYCAQRARMLSRRSLSPWIERLSDVAFSPLAIALPACLLAIELCLVALSLEIFALVLVGEEKA